VPTIAPNCKYTGGFLSDRRLLNDIDRKYRPGIQPQAAPLRLRWPEVGRVGDNLYREYPDGFVAFEQGAQLFRRVLAAPGQLEQVGDAAV